jgi:hypothetical protein
MVSTTTQYTNIIQGVLCLRMSYVLFHGKHVNVTSFTSIKRVYLPYADFHGILLSARQLYLQMSDTEFQPDRRICVENRANIQICR